MRCACNHSAVSAPCKSGPRSAACGRRPWKHRLAPVRVARRIHNGWAPPLMTRVKAPPLGFSWEAGSCAQVVAGPHVPTREILLALRSLRNTE
jgi:hypothetical protein